MYDGSSLVDHIWVSWIILGTIYTSISISIYIPDSPRLLRCLLSDTWRQLLSRITNAIDYCPKLPTLSNVQCVVLPTGVIEVDSIAFQEPLTISFLELLNLWPLDRCSRYDRSPGGCFRRLTVEPVLIMIWLWFPADALGWLLSQSWLCIPTIHMVAIRIKRMLRKMRTVMELHLQMRCWSWRPWA